MKAKKRPCHLSGSHLPASQRGDSFSIPVQSCEEQTSVGLEFSQIQKNPVITNRFMRHLAYIVRYSVVPINSAPLTITFITRLERHQFITTQNIQSLSLRYNRVRFYFGFSLFIIILPFLPARLLPTLYGARLFNNETICRRRRFNITIVPLCLHL